MSEPKCTKCGGYLEGLGKVIKAIIPDRNYEMSKAELHTCEDCGHRLYVTLEDDSNE